MCPGLITEMFTIPSMGLKKSTEISLYMLNRKLDLIFISMTAPVVC
jgi:hypothetical protein